MRCFVTALPLLFLLSPAQAEPLHTAPLHTAPLHTAPQQQQQQEQPPQMRYDYSKYWGGGSGGQNGYSQYVPKQYSSYMKQGEQAGKKYEHSNDNNRTSDRSYSDQKDLGEMYMKRYAPKGTNMSEEYNQSNSNGQKGLAKMYFKRYGPKGINVSDPSNQSEWDKYYNNTHHSHKHKHSHKHEEPKQRTRETESEEPSKASTPAAHKEAEEPKRTSSSDDASASADADSHREQSSRHADEARKAGATIHQRRGQHHQDQAGHKDLDKSVDGKDGHHGQNGAAAGSDSQSTATPQPESGLAAVELTFRAGSQSTSTVPVFLGSVVAASCLAALASFAAGALRRRRDEEEQEDPSYAYLNCS